MAVGCEMRNGRCSLFFHEALFAFGIVCCYSVNLEGENDFQFVTSIELRAVNTIEIPLLVSF